MKLILRRVSELLSDGIVNSSESFELMKDTFNNLIKQVNQLSISVIDIAKTIQNHHDAINDLYAMQDQIIQKMKGSVVDTNYTSNKKEKSPNKPNLKNYGNFY